MTAPGGTGQQAYRDPAEIGLAILAALAGKCRQEHPGWTDGQIAARLAIAYPGYDPQALEAELTDALGMHALSELWGALYDLTRPRPGKWIAVSRDEGKRTFTAGSTRELETCLRADYAGRAV
jgi:hypothetical protein